MRQNLEDAVTRLEGLIGDGATDVTALETALEEVTAAYAAADALLEADITTLQEQDTALSEGITALQTTLVAADDAIWDAIGQLQSDLDASEQTLSTVIIGRHVIPRERRALLSCRSPRRAGPAGPRHCRRAGRD